MLVLSRRLYETINIGDDIEIRICRIGQDQVRVGITAPKHIDIWRSAERPAGKQDADPRRHDDAVGRSL